MEDGTSILFGLPGVAVDRVERFTEDGSVVRLVHIVTAVGAENLRDQAIFVNHAPGAIAPLDPELIEIGDAVGQLP